MSGRNLAFTVASTGIVSGRWSDGAKCRSRDAVRDVEGRVSLSKGRVHNWIMGGLNGAEQNEKVGRKEEADKGMSSFKGDRVLG